jgi:hypothetical protein
VDSFARVFGGDRIIASGLRRQLAASRGRC